MRKKLHLFFIVFMTVFCLQAAVPPTAGSLERNHPDISNIASTSADNSTLTINDSDISSTACRGVDSSAVKYIVSGRPGPYNFEWRELGAMTTAGSAVLVNDTDSINITGLDGNVDYVVIVTDNANTVLCQDTFRLRLIGQIGLQLTQNTNTSCSASATAQVFIGTAIVTNPAENGYTFDWDSGSTEQTATGLQSGPQGALVTSPEGCTESDILVIAGPTDPLTISNPIITTPTCPGGTDGTISIQISGGNPSSGTFPYTIRWSTPGGDINRNPLTNDNGNGNLIPAGNYTVDVFDSDACGVSQSFTINEPAVVSIDGFTNVVQSTCTRGACDGRAEVLVSGGTNPGAGYDITWANGETGSPAITLCAGDNIVMVSNSGCPTVQDTITITSPTDVTANLINSSDARCYQQANGEIQVGGNGGTPNYSYSWADDNAIGGGQRTGLVAGTYVATAMDMNGCTSEPLSIMISEPDSMEVVIDLGGTLNPRCFGDENGIISVRWIRGGNMNTTPNYIWSSNTPNAPNQSVVTSLAAGTYSVTVVDGNGCQDEAAYTLTTPDRLIGQMTAPIEPLCFGDLTQVTVDTAIGGTGTSFTYSIDNGPQQQIGNISNVLAGAHIVTVFDRNACTWDSTIVIDQPDQVTVNLVDEITINLGDSVQFMPNIPMSVLIDSIIWTPPVNLSCSDCLSPWVFPTQTTTYAITVVDDNGCRGSDQVVINLDKARNVFVPNAFSPNGDGINDFFQVATGTGVNRINYLRIFDRWGSLLYQQDDYLPLSETDGWNGEFNGKDLSVGTYVFVSEVLFQDNIKLIYRGSLTLIR